MMVEPTQVAISRERMVCLVIRARTMAKIGGIKHNTPNVVSMQ